MPLLLWDLFVGAASQQGLCQCTAVLCMLPAFDALHGPLMIYLSQLYGYVFHAQILVSSPLSSSFTLYFLISSVSTWKITFLFNLSCPTLCQPVQWEKLCMHSNRLNVILPSLPPV